MPRIQKHMEDGEWWLRYESKWLTIDGTRDITRPMANAACLGSLERDRVPIQPNKNIRPRCGHEYLKVNNPHLIPNLQVLAHKHHRALHDVEYSNEELIKYIDDAIDSYIVRDTKINTN